MTPFIDIHTHNIENTDGLSIVNGYVLSFLGEASYSIGLHPWDIGKVVPDQVWVWMQHCIENYNIVAIGECGLDRAIDIPMEQQIQIFIAQINLANQYQKPLIIHCVRAWSDIFSIRKTYKEITPFIYHAFNGNEIIAKQIIASNGSLSFGKALLDSAKLQAVFVKLPLSAVFFETDTTAIKIEEIYQFAAKIRHICIDDLKQQIYNNYLKVFGK